MLLCSTLVFGKKLELFRTFSSLFPAGWVVFSTSSGARKVAKHQCHHPSDLPHSSPRGTPLSPSLLCFPVPQSLSKKTPKIFQQESHHPHYTKGHIHLVLEHCQGDSSTSLGILPHFQLQAPTRATEPPLLPPDPLIPTSLSPPPPAGGF